MSLDLRVAIDNAHDTLTTVVPAYATGRYLQPNLPHAIGIYFRQLGTCRMLLEGVPAPVFQAQMQAAGAYLFRLPKMADEDKVTSLAAVFWDAVAGGYTSAARDIAIHSRRTPNLDREHEDDFLYVMYLMQRYFMRPTDADAEALERHAGEQAARLARWKAVLEGGDDPRLSLCEALRDGDAEAFQAALLRTAAAREANLDNLIERGSLTQELALWMEPVWPEGLALLRLAERDGLSTAFPCPGVPEILRIPPPLTYDSNAWRTVIWTPPWQ
jgi:hypothetical protein